MPRPERRESIRNGRYAVHVLGAPPPGVRDLYHALLRVPWWAAFCIIVGGYLLLNGAFALLYLLSGGIANARPGSVFDAFVFSIETMGTIGYGNMYPVTPVANVLMVAESVTGLVVTALATGLVFVRFSQTRAGILFSSNAAVGRMDGVPTLMVRVGNERRGSIVDVRFRLTLTRATTSAEGVPMYRLEELPLVRQRAPALSRAWLVMHPIVEGSPLHGSDAEALARADGELQLEVTGVDDTSHQMVHARYTWFPDTIVWGSRLADVLSETPEGDLVVDLRHFHDVVPVAEGPRAPADTSPS
jgi:inward rectifier potassium channel